MNRKDFSAIAKVNDKINNANRMIKKLELRIVHLALAMNDNLTFGNTSDVRSDLAEMRSACNSMNKIDLVVVSLRKEAMAMDCGEPDVE